MNGTLATKSAFMGRMPRNANVADYAANDREHLAAPSAERASMTSGLCRAHGPRRRNRHHDRDDYGLGEAERGQLPNG
jgi:hypothetical protein